MAQDFAQVLDYYREFLKHDDPSRQVSWRTPYDQELRFENLLEAIDDEGVGFFSVLDVGCGLGDLFGYLRRTGREVDYLGVDIVPEMVERARERYPEGTFEVRDILAEPPEGRFSLVACSGGLTVRVPNHEHFVRKMLRRMLELSELAVAVNFQSTRAYRANPLARRDPDLFHTDPIELYKLCRKMCTWTVLREDMLGTDFTIYMTPGHARSVSRYQRKAQPTPDAAGIGWLLLERKLPKAALEVLDGAEASAAVRNLQGMAYHQLGDMRMAVERYREALALDPGYEPAKLNLESAAARQ